MTSLLLRLVGPMQAWGTDSRFSVRFTGQEPSKSGIVGLLCAALGAPRGQPFSGEWANQLALPENSCDEQLAVEGLLGQRLKMGVRVDREGVVRMDYHTAMNVVKAGGGIKDCEPSRRYYLADARFLVALQAERSLLQVLYQHLKSPVWPLFLGRKSFVPSLPVHFPDEHYAFREGAPAEVLRDYLWFASSAWEKEKKLEEVRKGPVALRTVLEVGFGATNEVREDQPVSFTIRSRRYDLRYVSSGTLPLKPEMIALEESLCTSHA